MYVFVCFIREKYKLTLHLKLKERERLTLGKILILLYSVKNPIFRFLHMCRDLRKFAPDVVQVPMAHLPQYS